MNLFRNSKLIILSGIFLFFSCSKSDSKNDSISSLLASSSFTPLITSLSTQKGSPFQSISGETYVATDVIITGRGFTSSLTGNTVMFNGVPAAVSYASTTEIRTSVPTGATSGLLSIVNNGGSCSSYDGRSGISCATSDFYIDCYTPYSNSHGAENLVEQGKTTTVNYKQSSTKAFKSYLNSGANTITISCESYASGVVVRHFSSSCVPSQETYTTNPFTITLNGPYTAQYFVTALSGNCTVTHN
ncbi:MAG: hypothetical protein L6Q54_10035 [Leptospiraceae bacterium]|nr:hypothetical protein [Leptospiraceae bacterium]MCK6381566.1 hypothetical protein [Leptospiraceae bacterium]NUM41671.1 hypothetical protein [Leptospiraceae bacterium]